MGLVLLAVATAGLVAQAAFLVACLRLRSPLSFVLGTFTAVWALLIVETMLLSLARSWTPGWMVGAIAAGLALAFALWQIRGRPRPPAFTPTLRATRAALHDPLLAIFAAGVAVAYGYLTVVALAIPPMDPDVLAYHLPRIVLWIQQHAVAAIPHSPGPNLDADPPGAEIAQGVSALLTSSDRYVSLFQLSCAPVGGLAVAGIARRIGLDHPAALFGALLFTAFPIVALQAPTAANDLALATAVLLAVYFGLGRSWAELGMMALAVALALSTKISGILALPVAGLVLVLLHPPARLRRVVSAAAVGVAVGSWWYFANLVRTGQWDGGLASAYGQVPSRAAADVLFRLSQYVLQTFDLAGVVGRDNLAFPVAGAVLIGAAVTLRLLRRSAASLALAGAGLIVAVAPWLVDWGHRLAARTVARAWLGAGHGDFLAQIPLAAAARPSPGEAWFGPAFVLVWMATLAAVAAGMRETARGRVIAVLVLGPALLYLVNASAFVYDVGRGRFFILAGGLAACTFGLVLRFRAVAWATMWVAVLALGLSLVHYRARPSGITLFEPMREATMWRAPRWQVNSAFSADVPAIVDTQRLGEAALADVHTIAVRADAFTPLYIVFGSGPWRRVVFAPTHRVVPAEADDLVVFGPTDSVDRSQWRQVPGPTTWALYRRASRGNS